MTTQRVSVAMFLVLCLVGCHATATGSQACAPNEYRVFDKGLCGKGSGKGQCRAKPAACNNAYAPVCACDGNVYASACAASRAGVDLAAMGCRAVIPDYIPCGAHYCPARHSYCEIYLSDVPELPTGHACRELPTGCQPTVGRTPDCDCFPPETPCLAFCGPIVTGGMPGLHLTCQGVREPATHDRRR